MDFLSTASVTAATVVLFVTQALKYVPVAWTSRYAVWVNIALSLIGTLVIKGLPVFTDLPSFVAQWSVIAVIAALAYNHLLAKAVASPAE